MTRTSGCWKSKKQVLQLLYTGYATEMLPLQDRFYTTNNTTHARGMTSKDVQHTQSTSEGNAAWNDVTVDKAILAAAERTSATVFALRIPNTRDIILTGCFSFSGIFLTVPT